MSPKITPADGCCGFLLEVLRRVFDSPCVKRGLLVQVRLPLAPDTTHG